MSTSRLVDAVIARVLACYAKPQSRVVVHGDVRDGRVPTADEAASTLVDLVVLVGPGWGPDAFGRCGRMLAPGGLLVAVLPPPPPVDVVAVVARAGLAGLRYLQHNVAFPVPLPCPAPAPMVSRARPANRRHARIHTDLLVFHRPDGDD